MNLISLDNCLSREVLEEEMVLFLFRRRENLDIKILLSFVLMEDSIGWEYV